MTEEQPEVEIYEINPKSLGIVKGYRPNRISFYILLLNTGRLDELNDTLWKDMQEYKE